jgi:hypothetical protein
VSPTESQATPRRWTVVLKSFGALVTFLLAVLGAVTGTLAWREDRAVRVDVFALPYVGPTWDNGLLRFSVVNQSRHAISIESGDLWLEGRRIGSVTYFLRNVGGTSPFTPQASELLGGMEQLPRIGVGAETTTVIAAGWVSSGRFHFAYDRLVTKNTLPEDTRTHFPSSDLPVFIKSSKTRLELRLKLAPGGQRKVQVPVLAATDEVSHGTQYGVARGWNVGLVRRRGIIKAMTVSGPRVGALATLRLWTRTSTRPVRTIVRPVSSEAGRFDLTQLAHGAYVWSLGDGQRIIATGTLVQPCRGQPSNTPEDTLNECSIDTQQWLRSSERKFARIRP